jgi:hypothetical protein
LNLVFLVIESPHVPLVFFNNKINNYLAVINSSCVFSIFQNNS